MNTALRILILEDSPPDVELIKQSIVQSGMQCTFKLSADRKSFKHALKSFVPQVILSDHSMAFFSSEEALKLSRAKYPHAPFIMVTGNESKEYEKKIIECGADNYILKDQLVRLPAAISSALQSRQMIEEKIIALQKMQDSEDKYRRLVNSITDGFISLDKNWNYTFLNEQASVMIKRSAEEMLGKNIWEVFSDLKGSKTYWAYTRAFELQQYFCQADYYPALDIWYESHIYPSADGISVIVRDVSDRRRLEESQSAILNTIPANIALLDATGCIVAVNRSWENFAVANCYQGSKYGVGENYIAVAAKAEAGKPADAGSVVEGLRAVLENRSAEFVHEYACHSPGKKRWFRMVVTPLRCESQAGAVVMHTDISALRILEEERMKNKTEEQKKITTAMLNAQEIERNAIGRELHDNVNQILAGTKLILSMLRNLPADNYGFVNKAMESLQYAINENRKIAHDLVAPHFDNTSLAEQLNSLFEEMLSKAGIEVCTQSDTLNEALLDDDQKLNVYRVAQEQCSNIIKYAGATQVNVSVCTGETVFSMRISDNGKGAQSCKTSKGIGMRNIRSRINLFNGKSSFETSPGNGFLLNISFPLNK